MTLRQTHLRAALLFIILAGAPVGAEPLFGSKFVVFDTQLNLVDTFAQREGVQVNQFEFLSNGNLLAMFYGDPIHVYTPSGGLIDTFGESIVQATALAVRVGSPDELYVADGALDLIRVFDASGLETGQITNPEFRFPTLLRSMRRQAL